MSQKLKEIFWNQEFGTFICEMLQASVQEKEKVAGFQILSYYSYFF